MEVQLKAEPVQVERVDGIMFVTLNRPRARNAVNSTLSQALGGALDEADRDPRVRVTSDAREGAAAFLEKRPPRWTTS